MIEQLDSYKIPNEIYKKNIIIVIRIKRLIKLRFVKNYKGFTIIKLG